MNNLLFYLGGLRKCYANSNFGRANYPRSKYLRKNSCYFASYLFFDNFEKYCTFLILTNQINFSVGDLPLNLSIKAFSSAPKRDDSYKKNKKRKSTSL